MKNLLLCLMLIVSGVSGAANNLVDDDISPWEYWRKGFESFEQGEQFYNAKKYDKAMAKYLNAKQAFLKVKQAKPNWKQDVIMQRVRLCEEKIMQLEYRQNSLKRSTISNRDDRAPTTSYRRQSNLNDSDNRFTFSGEKPLKPTTTLSETREIKLLKHQLKDYREKLFNTLVQLEDYRNKDKRSSSALSEIESLIKEKSVIKRKYQLLVEKYNILQQQRRPRATQDNKLVEEKMRSDLLSQKIKMYQANIKELQDTIISEKKNNQRDKFAVRKSDARISALEDEIKRLTRNVTTNNEQNKKISVELEKQQYINSIEQRKTQRYKVRLDKLTKWLNNSDKSKAATINKNIARENIAITQKLSSLQDKNDTLLRESMTLKSKLTTEHINLTKLKDMLSNSEKEKMELKYRLKKYSARVNKDSDNSTIQTDEITKLRQENRQLREDLNLFGKSYTKRSSGSNAGTVSQYKLIIDKLNSELATVKAIIQKNKLVDKSQQQQLAKLLDENRKLKDGHLDLVEENKNLRTFVKDYDAVTQANAKLKLKLSKGASVIKELNKLKQERIKLLKDNKTLADKLASYNKPNIVIPVKPPVVKQNSADYDKLKQTVEALQRKNSVMTTKIAEYRAQITRLKKEQDALAAHVGESKKTQTKAIKLKTAKLQTTIAELQTKLISIEKTAAKSQQAKVAAEKHLVEKNNEVARLEQLLNSSRKDIAKYQNKLKQRIQQAVKIKKTAPQILPEKLSDQQIAFLLQEGIQAEESNDYEAAAWHYRKIIANAPQHPEANRRLGLINLNRGNYGKSTQQLEKALRAAPKDAELLLAFASALSNNNKNSAALKIIKQVTALEPNNNRVYILNGTILQQLKQYKAAEKNFRRALVLAPNSAEANLKLAHILIINKKDPKMASACYHKALKLGIAHDPILDKKFSVKKQAGNSEAVSALQQMVVQHEAKKDYVAAAWCYSQLLELDKNNSELKLKYATVLLLNNKFKQSLPLLQAAVKNAKDKLTAQLLLGANYLLIGDTKAADKSYRQALTLLKATPKYQPTASIKQLNTTINKKLGSNTSKIFKQITAKLK